MSTSITRAPSRPSSCALCRPASPPRVIWIGCDAGHGRNERRARTWLVSIGSCLRQPPGGGSEALQRALARIGDLEEGIQLGELEQRLEVVVQVCETKLSALLSNLLR